MRAHTLFRFVLIAALVVLGVLWYRERAKASELANRWSALQQQEEKLSGLRAEGDRLREQLSVVGSDVDPASLVKIQPEHRADDQSSIPVAFSVGEWTPAAAWANEGRSTPLATIATFFWAAAGGDLAALRTALVFDDATRAKAIALFDTMPPATRSLYATPEDLIASVTMKNIPLTAAQLSWFNQTDADHAIIAVLLDAPKSPVDESGPVLETQAPNAPPQLSNPNPNPLSVLVLRRLTDGWRVVVPAAAIDRIADELRPPTEE